MTTNVLVGLNKEGGENLGPAGSNREKWWYGPLQVEVLHNSSLQTDYESESWGREGEGCIKNWDNEKEVYITRSLPRGSVISFFSGQTQKGREFRTAGREWRWEVIR